MHKESTIQVFLKKSVTFAIPFRLSLIQRPTEEFWWSVSLCIELLSGFYDTLPRADCCTCWFVSMSDTFRASCRINHVNIFTGADGIYRTFGFACSAKSTFFCNIE